MLVFQNCMPPLSRTSCLARCLMKSRDDLALPYSGFPNYDARNVLLKVSGQEFSSAFSPSSAASYNENHVECALWSGEKDVGRSHWHLLYSRICLEELRKNAKKVCLAAGVCWDHTPPLYEDTFRTYISLLTELFSKCVSWPRKGVAVFARVT
jgi:hypothetical protein